MATRKVLPTPVNVPPTELGAGHHYTIDELARLAIEVRGAQTCPMGHRHASGVHLAIDHKDFYMTASGAHLLISVTCREPGCTWEGTLTKELRP